MILSDRDFHVAQKAHTLIDPLIPENVGPCSVDLTLGPEEHWFEIIRNGEKWSTEEWELLPGDFVLGTTKERVYCPNEETFGPSRSTGGNLYRIAPALAAQIRGKSSHMRRGLQVCSDAGYIDTGFRGQVTLELKNLGTEVIKLVPGMKICQIVFIAMSSPVDRPYGSEGLGSHYQNQQGVQGSKL